MSVPDRGTGSGLEARGDERCRSARAVPADYRLQLDRLVQRLLRANFGSARDLWTLQVKLLDLQRGIQTAIRETKRRAARDRDELDDLRSVLWHARRFGDALAWILLGLERQFIYPLAQNARVPVPTEDHGHRGALAIAAALSGQEWGFPLLHDVTDCLRIGDITFIKPEADNTTVEAKTKLVGETERSDGKVSYEYQVTVLSPSEPPALAAAPREESETSPTRLPTSERIERQLRRLHVARSHQTADRGKVHEIDGAPVLTVAAEASGGDHSDALRRVVRRARRCGYGSEAVDNAFLYVALYDKNGIDVGRLPSLWDSIPKDLVSSGIFFEEDRTRNSLVVCSVPSPEGRGAQLYLPYFLLPLPRTAISDIVHGRMIIFSLVNSGRVSEALENEGFEVAYPTGRNDLSAGSMVVTMEIEHDGQRYRAEWHNLQMHLDEMVMEFKPLSYIMDIARAMRDNMVLAIEHRAAARRNDGSEVA